MEDGLVSWGELLIETTTRFEQGGVGEPVVSARRIVEEASGWDGAELGMHLHDPATVKGVAHLDAMVERRLTGEPLQYVVGRWGFRLLDLMVDDRVLIPRPETEEVAGWAIAEARRFERPVVADLGTGTGAIGLSVATEVETAEVHLTDLFDDALAVARANLVGVGRAATRVTVSAGSWFDALPDQLRGGLHVVVSNPPYVGDREVLPDEVDRWEPSTALRAGNDGLRDLLPIARASFDWLTPGGALVLEMAPGQTETVAAHCRNVGFPEVRVEMDLNRRPRAVIARK